MPRYMLTGTYSSAAAKAMVDTPSDREEAGRKIVEAAGGQLESYYVSTGPTDFVLICSAPSTEALLAGVMVAAGSGTMGRLETQQLFTGAEFSDIQKKAGDLRSAYMSAV